MHFPRNDQQDCGFPKSTYLPYPYAGKKCRGVDCHAIGLFVFGFSIGFRLRVAVFEQKCTHSRVSKIVGWRAFMHQGFDRGLGKNRPSRIVIISRRNAICVSGNHFSSSEKARESKSVSICWKTEV